MRALVFRDDFQRLRNAAFASTVNALAIGVFLVIRRMTAEASVPLPVPQLLTAAAALLVWSLGLHLLLSRDDERHQLAIRVMIVTITAHFALASSYPAKRAIDWLVWLTVLAVTVFTPQAFHRARRLTRRSPEARPQPPKVLEIAQATGGRATEECEPVLQQITRLRTAQGGDVIQATLTAEFPPGERGATLYIAFCPPFEFLPEVEASVADGPEAQVNVVQLLHNGAQLDVLLSDKHSTAERVLVEVLAAEQSVNDQGGETDKTYA